MDKLSTALGGLILLIFTVFLFAVFGGTILWLIYDHIHALFPKAAESGIIAQHLNWWDAVCVTWISSILIKGSTTSTKSSK